MNAIEQAFIVESYDLVHDMKEMLMQTEISCEDSETINALFRAVRSIKGGSGIIGCKFIVEFTQVIENVLAEIRSGSIIPQQSMRDILLICADHLVALTDCVKNGSEPDEQVDRMSYSLSQKLHRFLVHNNDVI